MRAILLACLLLCVCCSILSAQERTIRGKVTDANREALIGVNIQVKNTTKGTVTEIDGSYELEGVAPTDVLVVTYTGMLRQELRVGNRTTIDVIMNEDANQLDEVIVVGYGTTRRRDVMSSISSVSAEEVSRMPVASIDQAIQGRAAGVQVIKNTGAPGGGVSIRVRGTGSINGNQEPLYVIDGVPINNTFSGSTTPAGANFNYGGQAGNEVINGLAGINFDDIESIEILKDAASASIYGARAANGVVLITTKRGQVGRSQVSINSYFGFQNLARRYDLLNAQQFAAVVNEAQVRAGALDPVFIRDTPFDTDWQNEIFRTAPMVNTSLSFSGGSDKTQYLVSLSYFNQQGIVINSGFDRVGFRTNLDHKISDRFKVGTNLFLSYSNSQRLRNTGGPNVQDDFNGNAVFGPSVIASALTASPLIPVFDPNTGFYAADTLNSIKNPVALARELDLNSYSLRALGNFFAELELIKGLRFRTNLGADIRDENEEFFFGETPGVGGSGRLQRRSFRELIWLSENYLTYNTKLGESHSIELLGGASFQKSVNDGYTIGLGSIIGTQVTNLSASNDILAPYSDPDNTWAMVSYFTRARYDFQNKYYFSGTMRVDGSSRFGPNRQYGFFPSGSLGWRVSEEAFFGNLKSTINELKVRGSYGLTGNDQIPPFGWRASAVQLNTNYIGQIGTVPISIQNEDYSWESTVQLDVGVDIGLFEDRFGVVVDYYKKTARDLLLFVPLPQTTGFGAALSNIGSIENRGWEFGLTGRLIDTRDFSWSGNFNITFNKNEVLELVGGQDVTSGSFGYANVARVGLPISFQLFRLEETVDPVTGNRRVRDLNGNGIRDAGDIEIVGSPLPKHFGGFSNNFRYKNFDANLFFQWSYGNLIINNTRSFIQNDGKSTINRIGTNLSTEALNRWQREGDVTNFPAIDYTNNQNVVNGLSAAGVPTDQNLEDGSYLRLKNLTIGYTLPKTLLTKWGMSSARIYFTANNLLTFTRYSGYDPEVNHNTLTNLAVGYDDGTYPQARVFLFGFNVNL